MAYVGQTYRIGQIGGWNANPDLDLVPKECMIDPENINIHRGGRQPRGGTEVANGDLVATGYVSTTKLMSHFDGADAATAYIDPIQGAATFVGTAALDTAQKKFGTTSLLLDGNSDYITYPDSADWYLGTGDFTIDMWVRFAVKQGSCFFEQRVDNDNYYMLYYVSGTDLLCFKSESAASFLAYYRVSWIPVVDTWYHIAFVRSGASVYIFIDGVSQALIPVVGITVSTSFPNLAATFKIGFGAYTNYYINGWIDEFRIQKGVAAWTADFDPPIVPYAQDNYTGITGVYHFIRENGQLSGYYVVDENADNIGDENGNYLVSEGSDIIVGTSDGDIIKNYTENLKADLTANLKYYFETFYDELYITNGEDKPQVYGNNLSYAWDMGSPKPCVAALGGDGGAVTSGTHSYKITFVTASGESSGSIASNVVTAAEGNDSIDLTSIEVGPTGTTQRKIYRTAAGGTAYLLLATLDNNTATTYTDDIADGSLTDAIPTTSLAFLPTDWQSDWPKYFLKHGRGVHKRLWAYGVEGHPNMLYASANGLADFSNTNTILIKIMTNKITGCVEFGGNLVIFSRDKTFILDDVAIGVMNWGYQAAQWDGGAAHQRLIVKTPRDVAVMDETGNIFSIMASQQVGDYQIASLTKPTHIDKWIKENVDLLKIDKFHAIYDSELRAIKWFMISKDSDNPDICLVYFIDYATWTKHTFNLYHLCSNSVKVNESLWKIYTGGFSGKVFSLESDTLLDDGTYYRKYFKTPLIHIDNPRASKMFDRLSLIVKPQGTELLNYKISIDNREIGTFRTTLPGASDFMQNIISYIGATGLRLQLEFFNNDNDDFFISEIMVDYQLLGSADEYAYATADLVLEFGYVYLGFFSFYTQDCERYNPINNSWTILNDLPLPYRVYSSANTILSKSYICGGIYIIGFTVEILQNCDEYTPLTNSWASKTDILSAKTIFSASTIMDKGYIYGGRDDSIELQDCDKYDSIADSWTAKTDIPTPGRSYSSATTILNNGYIFNGTNYGGSELYADCDSYNVSGDSWTNKTDMPTSKFDSKAFTIADKGYVVGGQNLISGLSDCLSYTIGTNAWTSKAVTLNNKNCCSASAIYDKGYVYGGYMTPETNAYCDEYSANIDTWKRKANMSSSKAYTAASTI